MARIVPTRMIGIPPYSLVVNHRGGVSEVGPWTRITATSHTRVVDGIEQSVDPDELLALIVPSTQDAVMNLIAAGFQIKSAEVIEPS